MKLDEELSFREAAHLLRRKRDSRGRRLQNMVLAREKQTGKQIAIRLNDQLRVTLGALYRAFPELQASQSDKLARLVQPLMEKTDERVRVLVREVLAGDIGPRVTLLEQSAAITEEYISKMAQLRGQFLPKKTSP